MARIIIFADYKPDDVLTVATHYMSNDYDDAARVVAKLLNSYDYSDVRAYKLGDEIPLDSLK